MLNVVAPSVAVATATESVAVLALPLLLPQEPRARLSIRVPNAGKNSFLISKVFFYRAFVYPYGENRILVLLLRVLTEISTCTHESVCAKRLTLQTYT